MNRRRDHSDSGNLAESDDEMMMRSPSNFLVLSRSPSRGLVREISALRERREVSRSGRNGSKKKYEFAHREGKNVK